MRRTFVVLVLALVPVTARGALTLRAEDVTICPGETEFVELYFEETQPAQDEQLILYAVRLGIVGNPGVRFGPAEQVGNSVEHPFVLPSPHVVVDDTEVTDQSLYAFVHSPNAILEGVNVADGMGALRFPVTVAAGTPGGLASLVFDLNVPPGEAPTELVDEIGTLLDVTLQSGTITICPEPSSSALALFGAALVTLRRR